MNISAQYLVLAICAFVYGGTAVSEPAQSAQPILQAEEINERMTLYKRIKFEQNKKVLMQLLHDIADIQKQCRDKGYLCNVEGSDDYGSLLIDLNHAPDTRHSDDTVASTHAVGVAMPDLRLLGIVGGRARFGLEDGRIEDFALGELVADFWKVAEIATESALLVSEEQPDIKVRYRIHREPISNEATTEVAR